MEVLIEFILPHAVTFLGPLYETHDLLSYFHLVLILEWSYVFLLVEVILSLFVKLCVVVSLY